MIAFILLLNKEKDIRLNLRKLKFEKEKLKNILVIGLPTAIGGSTMQFGFLLTSRNVLKYGTQAMAAYGSSERMVFRCCQQRLVSYRFIYRVQDRLLEEKTDSGINLWGFI